MPEAEAVCEAEEDLVDDAVWGLRISDVLPSVEWVVVLTDCHTGALADLCEGGVGGVEVVTTVVGHVALDLLRAIAANALDVGRVRLGAATHVLAISSAASSHIHFAHRRVYLVLPNLAGVLQGALT